MAYDDHQADPDEEILKRKSPNLLQFGLRLPLNAESLPIRQGIHDAIKRTDGTLFIVFLLTSIHLEHIKYIASKQMPRHIPPDYSLLYIGK